MRELERIADHLHVLLPRDVTAIAVVGAGRVGTALAAALNEAGYGAGAPLGRGEVPSGADAVLLGVPAGETRAGAEGGGGSAAFAGHTGGAPPLPALAPADGHAFGLHPLQTVTGAATRFEGC